MIVLAAVASCSAGDDVPAPLVGSVFPDHAAAGTVVEVRGDYFCQRAEELEDPLCDPGGAVHFGAVPGITVTWSETLIQTEVPNAGAGHVSLTVIVSGRASNAIGFTIE
ncbi:MAG TPA: IPT/TIG domain-containing protein [Kofleriaceae bacterium]|nr:IPT/TIG domain-containing protein [Kofleriaceae bacterium]